MEWKYSALGVRSLAHGVSTLPYGKDALATMKPETRAALQSPSSQAWHDGSVVIDSSEAVNRCGGAEGVEAMHFAAVKHSIGPVMAPFLKVSLALFGASPDTLFTRMNTNLATVMRGVVTEWKRESPTAGQLLVTHPDEVQLISWPCWRGSLKFTFDICGVDGEVTARQDLSKGRNLIFDLRWKK